jgi:benzoyl-CoA reductase/2-hydroxyglutaryl-CoA dehydratase subunit BcrC/BadD/HgdB
MHLGQILQGMSGTSPRGEKISPDVVLQVCACYQDANLAQTVADYFGIPFIELDMPLAATKSQLEYVVGQFHDAIEQIEKILDRQCNDEMLIEAVKNEWTTRHYTTQVAELLKNKPSPLDAVMFFASLRPAYTNPYKKEVVDFYKELFDELKDHVRYGISGRGFERARISFSPGPPHFDGRLPRHVEKYGAVTITMAETHPGLCQVWDRDKDGTWHPLKPLEESGIEMKSRDDALRTLARLYIGKVTGAGFDRFEDRANWAVERAQQWDCDGLIFSTSPTCCTEGVSLGEARFGATAAGVPNVAVESPMVDIDRFDKDKWKQTVDNFLETRLGLEPIMLKEEEGYDEDAG